MQYSRYARATASNKVGMPGLPSGDPGVDHKSTARGQGRKQPGLQALRGPGARGSQGCKYQGARALQKQPGL